MCFTHRVTGNDVARMPSRPESFSFTFNGSLRVETRGYNLSPDAGAFILRELEDKLDLVNLPYSCTASLTRGQSRAKPPRLWP